MILYFQNLEGDERIIGYPINIEETQNKDGGVSIQFPVFEGVRFDKIEPSYN